MKKILFLTLAAVVTLFSGITSYAQDKYGATAEQSAECKKYLSYYQEYFKQKDYNSALPNWRKAFNICPPSANQNMLLNGATLIRQLITKTKDEKYKGELVDTLLTIHDLRAANFPNYAATALNNKGLDIMNYVTNDNEFVFNELKKISETNGVETAPNILVVLMNSAVALYNEGKLDQETILMEYENAMELLDKIGSVKKDEPITNYTTPIENLFLQSKVADCDRLIELFTPRLAADANSYETAANIVRMLSTTEGCIDNELFVAAAAQMHSLQPSSRSAYAMFRIYNSRGDIVAATTSMLEAIELEEDNDQKADYYFEISQAIVANNGSSVKAFEYAQKSAQLDTDNSVAPRAYMLCGTIWGAAVCKGNEIEARAPYWVAIDYFEKAKRADSSLTESCNKSIAQYSKFFPTTADAFMYDVTDGESYTVSCNGMTATTTVRTQK